MTVPFDQLDGVIWFDGKLVPGPEARIHVLTHGLHYASCVFEGERAYGGVIFKSTEHSERLRNSANILDFEIPYRAAEIDAAKRLVLNAAGAEAKGRGQASMVVTATLVRSGRGTKVSSFRV